MKLLLSLFLLAGGLKDKLLLLGTKNFSVSFEEKIEYPAFHETEIYKGVLKKKRGVLELRVNFPETQFYRIKGDTIWMIFPETGDTSRQAVEGAYKFLDFNYLLDEDLFKISYPDSLSILIVPRDTTAEFESVKITFSGSFIKNLEVKLNDRRITFKFKEWEIKE